MKFKDFSFNILQFEYLNRENIIRFSYLRYTELAAKTYIKPVSYSVSRETEGL